MFRRSREKVKTTDRSAHYMVIGFFVVFMAATVFYYLLNPKQNFGQMQVIDEAMILVHNG